MRDHRDKILARKELFLGIREYIRVLFQEYRFNPFPKVEAEELEPELFERALALDLLIPDRKNNVRITKDAIDTYNIG